MRVLNFGSLNLDHVYQVPHFLEPGETLGAVGYQKHFGGKGLNQSIALARAGCQVFHAGCIGEDGRVLQYYLQENGVDVSCVETISTPTGHAIIQIDPAGQNCILLYGGANQQVSRAYIDQVFSKLPQMDALLLQNEISNLAYLIEQAAQKGIQIVLNPSPIDDTLTPELLSRVDTLILNEVEGAALSGCSDEQDCLKALREKYPKQRIVLTLGEQGAWYYDKGQSIYQSAFSVPVADTSAAGDTFTGFLLGALFQGKTPAESMKIAAKASALAVSKPGTAESIPYWAELAADI